MINLELYNLEIYIKNRRDYYCYDISYIDEKYRNLLMSKNFIFNLNSN